MFAAGVGTVILIVPVGVVHVGWNVTLAVGADGWWFTVTVLEMFNGWLQITIPEESKFLTPFKV